MVNRFIPVLTLLIAISTAANAQIKVDLYGNVTLATWFDKESDFYRDILSIDNSGTVPDTLWGEDPYPVYYTDFQPAGYLGMNIVIDRLKACFEFGVGRNVYDTRFRTSSGTGGDYYMQKYNLGAKFNKIVAEWSFNENLSILFGKNITPCNFSISNQALYGGNGFSNSGVLNGGSRPLLQLNANIHPNSSLKITGKFAFVTVDTVGTKTLCDFNMRDSVYNGITYKYVEKSIINKSDYYKPTVSIPKMEIASGIHFVQSGFSVNFNVAGGYQVYDVTYKAPYDREDIDTTDITEKFEGWVYGTSADLSIGPVMLGATYSGGKNLGVYGINIGNPFKWRDEGAKGANLVNIFFPSMSEFIPDFGALLSQDSADNVRTLDNSYASEMAFIASVKILKNLSMEGGFGIVSCTHDSKNLSDAWYDTYAGYGQIEYKLSNIIVFTPEFGYYRYGPLGGQGTFMYWGLNTTIKIPNIQLK